MAEPCESAFTTDVHGHDTLGVNFCAGIAGGCAGVLAGHPLDTIKVRLQSITQVGPNPEYRGGYHCFTRIIADEGVMGLYKGMASPLVGVAIINSLLFGVYGYSLNALGNPDSINTIFWAGAISGVVNGFFSCPMELIKIRLQNQHGENKVPKIQTKPTFKSSDVKYLQSELDFGKRSFSSAATAEVPYYKGPLDCIKQIYSSKGIRGFFQGLNCTLLRETPSYAAYFATYEFLCEMMLDNNTDNAEPSLKMLFAGGVAGVICWIVTYPLDVIKTRLQSVEQEKTGKYKGTLDCFRQVIKTEGYSSLTKGLGATCVRAFPTNAATFYAVSWAKKVLSPFFASSTIPLEEEK